MPERKAERLGLDDEPEPFQNRSEYLAYLATLGHAAHEAIEGAPFQIPKGTPGPDRLMRARATYVGQSVRREIQRELDEE